MQARASRNERPKPRRVDDAPLVLFTRWFARAARAGIALPEAMALATVGADRRPSVRFVLLKHVDARGLVFFTDGRSRKGRELRITRRAAAVFYWHRIGRQVRVEGSVEEISRAESDDYWQTRPRASRLAAVASTQSAMLASRDELLARWRELGVRYRGKPVPRPAAWIGFRIRPEVIEFWTRGANRLHKRECYRRRGTRWTRSLLQP